MKKLNGLAGIVLAAALVLSSVSLWRDPPVARGQDAGSKISSRLDLEIKDKLEFIHNSSQAPQGASPRLAGKTLTEISRQKLFIYTPERPTRDQIAEMQGLGVTVDPDSWIPPVGRHTTGFVFAEALVDQVAQLAGKYYISSLETAEAMSKPVNNVADTTSQAASVWPMGYTGAGVNVAVLDSGLDLTHADIPTPIAKKDYSNYPNFLDDTINNTVTGHGTHVTATVLGRGTLSASNTGNVGGPYKGAAPGANLIFLKIGLDGSAGATTAAEVGAIKAAVDTYNARVITLSYGGWSQYHDGTSPEDQAVDYAVSHGAVFFGAAGNEAADAMHYSGTAPANSSTGFIQVNVTGSGTTADTFLAFNLVWFDGLGVHNPLGLEYYNSSQILIPTGNPTGNPTGIQAGPQSESTRGTESIESYWTTPVSGGQTYYLKVHNNSGNSQFFHIYYDGDIHNGADPYSVQFQIADPNYTLSSPAEADSAITVGAYVSRSSWTSYQGSSVGYGETVGTIANFSSRGPRVDTGAPIKPDIVAPGSSIISARDHDVYPIPSGSYGALVVDNDGAGVGPGNTGPADYYVMEGTSMATPHAAGIAALLLSKNPSLTPADIKSYLQNTATNKGASNIYGYGLVNALAAINAVPLPATPTPTVTPSPTATPSPTPSPSPSPTASPSPSPSPTPSPSPSPTASPSPTPSPTPSPSPSPTASPSPSPSPTPSPSPSPSPTASPSPTPSPTPSPSPTPTASPSPTPSATPSPSPSPTPSPGPTPTPTLSLQADTELIPDVDSSGYAVVHARISRIKDSATGNTFLIGDGIGAYDASATYGAAGVTAVTVNGQTPFGAPTAALNTLSGTTTTFSASQTGAAPVPPLTVADLRLRLVGSKDIVYTVTLNFNSITRVSGGAIPQSAPATASFMRGDARADGSVTIADALFIAQYLAGLRGLGTDITTVNAVNAATVMHDAATPDVGDSISITDALFIAQMLAGLRNASYQ